MSKFDTQPHTEDTYEYGYYVDADELSAIEAEATAKYDEGDDYDDDDYDADASYADWAEMQSQYDDDRDTDFYGS